MSQAGWVAGSSNLVSNGPQHSFIWYGYGPLVDLGTLGGANCAVDGPNLYDEAAELSEISKSDPDHEDFCAYGTHLQCLGVVWRYGKLTALRTLPGGRNAIAFGINNLGQAVGRSENGVRDSCAKATPFQVFRFEAVKWEPMVRSECLVRKVGFSMGINDLGQTVGSSENCSTQGGLHAVRWKRTAPPRRPARSCTRSGLVRSGDEHARSETMGKRGGKRLPWFASRCVAASAARRVITIANARKS